MISVLYIKFGWSILSNRKQALYNEEQHNQHQNEAKNDTLQKSLQLNYIFNMKRQSETKKARHSTTRLPLTETAGRDAKLVRQTTANERR
jgi:hypothetical protein